MILSTESEHWLLKSYLSSPIKFMIGVFLSILLSSWSRVWFQIIDLFSRIYLFHKQEKLLKFRSKNKLFLHRFSSEFFFKSYLPYCPSTKSKMAVKYSRIVFDYYICLRIIGCSKSKSKEGCDRTWCLWKLNHYVF